MNAEHHEQSCFSAGVHSEGVKLTLSFFRVLFQYNFRIVKDRGTLDLNTKNITFFILYHAIDRNL